MILITGCARSGTSVTANIIKACGANMGKVNANGENRYIRDEVVKPYLSSQGYDPLCQDKLPNPNQVQSFPDLEGHINYAIGEWEPRAYKGAKMCHFHTVWADAFPDAKWIVVRRDKDKIVESCIRTCFMRKRHGREEWGEWVDEHLERFEEILSFYDAIEVWPDRAINGDLDEYKRMVEFCGGLEWSDEAEQVIDPRKWHG